MDSDRPNSWISEEKKYEDLDKNVKNEEECKPTSDTPNQRSLHSPLSPQPSILSNEASSSTDSTSLASMSGQKKDKLCLVCGDKALGYNFNAVSCESCKAFFRRNAHKTYRGRCEGKCDVTKESRSFCKKCRLAKCFSVGMRKDMILSKQQKEDRKQKIIINKLKRKIPIAAQDTYSASAKDLLYPLNPKTPTDPLQQPLYADKRNKEATDDLSGVSRGIRHRSRSSSGSSVTNLVELPPFQTPRVSSSISSPLYINSPSPSSSPQSPNPFLHSPHLSAASRRQLQQDLLQRSRSISDSTIAYKPWMDDQNKVVKATQELPEKSQQLLVEALTAFEDGQFLSATETPSDPQTKQTEGIVNLAEGIMRKLIVVAKNIEYFKTLHKDDQINLLKSSAVDIMVLRSAVNYDPFTESWSLATKSCFTHGSGKAVGERISADILKMKSPETKQMFMTYSKFIKSLMKTLHADLVMLKLLILVSLFSADRIEIKNHKQVTEAQERYAVILQEYVHNRFSQEKTLFAQTIMKLVDLRNLNEVHSSMIMSMDIKKLQPLLLEIFDLTEPSGSGTSCNDGVNSSATSSSFYPSSSSTHQSGKSSSSAPSSHKQSSSSASKSSYEKGKDKS